MPTLELYVKEVRVAKIAPHGFFQLKSTFDGLNRVLLRRLTCLLRSAGGQGIWEAIIDPGSPLTLLPYSVWSEKFNWQPGIDYDELEVDNADTPLTGKVRGHTFSFKLARLRVPIELIGKDLTGPRIRVESLIVQLLDAGPPYILIGLWGGALEGKRLSFNRLPQSDELAAKLDFRLTISIYCGMVGRPCHNIVSGHQ